MRLRALNSTCIQVRWKNPRQPNGRLRGFQIHYQAITKRGEPISDWKMYDLIIDDAAAAANAAAATEEWNRNDTGLISNASPGERWIEARRKKNE